MACVLVCRVRTEAVCVCAGQWDSIWKVGWRGGAGSLWWEAGGRRSVAVWLPNRDISLAFSDSVRIFDPLLWFVGRDAGGSGLRLDGQLIAPIEWEASPETRLGRGCEIPSNSCVAHIKDQPTRFETSQ
ncbi:hypothetical protein AAG570_011351 [Ranatra chinensis]|uniref:Uncharacterized protein n=1 Tax=Ranatra chinensis TaxID=642074 RepID=A0ABD0Z6M1_9HEMI